MNELESLGGNLGIINNTALLNLEGLEGLKAINGHLWIQGNKALADLGGLDGVESIQAFLSVWNNPSLETMEGLGKLTSVGGYVRIGVNDRLTDLAGLESLISVGRHLWIWSNPSLTHLAGLEQLFSVGTDLDIYNNDALVSLEGLSGLTSVGGILTVDDNDRLTSLKGLENVDPASIGTIVIEGNKSLSHCSVKSICNYLITFVGLIEVHDNAPGCASFYELIEACKSSGIEQHKTMSLALHPNPFSRTTPLTYELAEPATVTIVIYNQFGEQVRVIEKGRSTGQQQVVLNAGGLAAGIYYCVLSSENGTRPVKLIKQ